MNDKHAFICFISFISFLFARTYLLQKSELNFAEKKILRFFSCRVHFLCLNCPLATKELVNKNQGSISISPTFYAHHFYASGSESKKKKHWWHDCIFFALLGSARVKTARKHVDEIDQWLFYQTLCAKQKIAIA